MADVEALAAKNPIVGRDFSLQRVENARAKVRHERVADGGARRFPLAPFRALEGVDSGAAGDSRLQRHRARSSRGSWRSCPSSSAPQLELLLYDVEDRETVDPERRRDRDDGGERAARLASRSSACPPTSRSRSPIRRARSRKRTRRCSPRATSLVPLTQVSDNVKLAGDSWATMFARRGPDEPPRTALRRARVAERRPRRSARPPTSCARSPTEINTLTGGTKLDAAVDHATWRAAQLVALFFALLVAYRLLAWRLGAKPRA